jgi:hypothetical protein
VRLAGGTFAFTSVPGGEVSILLALARVAAGGVVWLIDIRRRKQIWHCERAAASRTFWMVGSNRPRSTAMTAITTSNSISVKPRRGRGGQTAFMWEPPRVHGGMTKLYQHAV